MRELAAERVHNWRRRPFIVRGYRPEKGSFIYCLKSLFWTHNQSGNIYTHLFGAVMMAILWYHKLVCNSNDNYKIVDKLLFSGLFIACTNCFLTSALFHTFECHSREVHKIFAKFDYLGISTVMMSVMTVWLYYGFYYSPVAQKVYMTIFTVYCITLFVVSLFDKFSDPEYLSFRGLCFMVEGFYAAIPVFHYCYNTLFFEQMLSPHLFKSLTLILMSSFFNMTGAVIYITKLPEKWRPNLFAIWFNSHQLFHVNNILGAIFYFHGISLLIDIRLNFPLRQKTYIQFEQIPSS